MAKMFLEKKREIKMLNIFFNYKIMTLLFHTRERERERENFSFIFPVQQKTTEEPVYTDQGRISV